MVVIHLRALLVEEHSGNGILFSDKKFTDFNR